MSDVLLIDTDVLIDAGRGVSEAVTVLQQAATRGALAVSVVTEMELIVGCRNSRELDTLTRFLTRFSILYLDRSASEQAAQLLRQYRLSHNLLIPDALIVAEPNGAGKTTFALEYVTAYPRAFLSADAIAQRLRPAAPTEARVQAGRVFFAELGALIRSGESFVVESTLAGLGYGRVLERLKQAGYTVTIAFVFVESTAACNGIIHYERPDGTLTTEDPYDEWQQFIKEQT